MPSVFNSLRDTTSNIRTNLNHIIFISYSSSLLHLPQGTRLFPAHAHFFCSDLHVFTTNEYHKITPEQLLQSQTFPQHFSPCFFYTNPIKKSFLRAFRLQDLLILFPIMKRVSFLCIKLLVRKERCKWESNLLLQLCSFSIYLSSSASLALHMRET